LVRVEKSQEGIKEKDSINKSIRIGKQRSDVIVSLRAIKTGVAG